MENNALFGLDFCTCLDGEVCKICSSSERVSKFKESFICEECIGYLKSIKIK